MSCPVSVYCDGMECHALCLYTMTGCGVMTCVYILWWDGVSCHVSVYCDGMECHALCLYTVTGLVSCRVSVYCDGVGCHVLCLYTVTEWSVMSCVCIL